MPVRYVPAQAGWIVDTAYDDAEGPTRALYAVVEWEFDAEAQESSALCWGPLGSEFEGTAFMVKIDLRDVDARVRFAPDEMTWAPRPAD
jgi:hypothetical protein